VSYLKNLAMFMAGMAFGEFVLRWVIHATYLSIIGFLLLRLSGKL
jgi:hypothetical protein